MLARWFDRSGLGQVLAPDEKIAAEPEPDESRAPFWQLVAPDPNFVPPRAKVPPQVAFLSPPTSTSEFRCVHCNRMSPVTPTPALTPTLQSDIASGLRTPSPLHSNRNAQFSSSGRSIATPGAGMTSPDLADRVLSAAKQTAACGLPHQLDARQKVLRLCASSKPLNDKNITRLRKMLKKHPAMLNTRAAHLGTQVPNGFTPLMAAALANQVQAGETLLELSSKGDSDGLEYPKDIHLDRDLEGRTPLHIAAELGHIEIIKLLIPYYQDGKMEIAPDSGATDGLNVLSSPPPMDLLGVTRDGLT